MALVLRTLRDAVYLVKRSLQGVLVNYEETAQIHYKDWMADRMRDALHLVAILRCHTAGFSLRGSVWKSQTLTTLKAL